MFFETDTHKYMHNVNNSSTRKKGEICSKLARQTPEQLHWSRSCVFIVNFENISHLVCYKMPTTMVGQLINVFDSNHLKRPKMPFFYRGGSCKVPA